MKFSSSRKVNNSGYTLIELIVVISIMAVLTGTLGFSASLVFSRDAEKCATRLNDAIYTTRMNSMSKSGAYELTVASGTANIATIACDGTDETEIYLDNVEADKKTNLTAKFVTEDGTSTSLSLPVKIAFDKSKGNVKFDVDGDGTPDDGIIVFDVAAIRGNRTSKVQLVTTTGKHTIGDF